MEDGSQVNDPDYIVFRGTGVPGADYRWYDRSGMQPGLVNFPSWFDPSGLGSYQVYLYPTGMIDVREDGAVAEIWAPKDWKVSPE